MRNGGAHHAASPSRPSNPHDLRMKAIRFPMLTDEERSSPVVHGALRLCAIDILEHGLQPADIARTLALLSKGRLLWDPKYAEWLAWTGTHWNTSDAGWE